MPAFGTTEITSLFRRYIVPHISDQVYKSAVLFYRMKTLNSINLGGDKGGIQIEIPLLWRKWTGFQWMTGYEQLSIAPQDNVINAFFQWKQLGGNVAISLLEMQQANEANNVRNFVTLLKERTQQAIMAIRDTLNMAMWSTAPQALAIDSVPTAVDNGTLQATYGGLSHATYAFWNAQITNNGNAALSLTGLNTFFNSCVIGGQRPTIGITDQARYAELICIKAISSANFCTY